LNQQPSQTEAAEVNNMMRLAITAAMLLCSITMASAQEQTGAAPPEVLGQQNCMFAGGEYSQGAEFCVTNDAGLKCDKGKWSRDAELDCGGGASEEHMMPDHMMPDHMMPHQ
jgi:hypothetical protein